MLKILFVCHGNICRSPMAEFLFKKMISDAGIDNQFIVESAATSSEEIWNGIGNPVYPPAKRKLKEHGMECDGKRARQITKDDYSNYDLLIGMDERNIQNMLRLFGKDNEKKIHLLLEYAGEEKSISDPWYSNDFDTAYHEIERGCKALLEQLSDKSSTKNDK
ncbi:low molecular weight protein-tyrosine-phosphatase [Filifactor alocis]|uniref:low molecular weight protein-tyrosine-phosphatase n=1 Tax=Filifactor alocis TaxID=143361 RepID=UPI0028D9005D|nr:low molecular weight protein-tyrosine-phosphatase [Filifactor alocis]